MTPMNTKSRDILRNISGGRITGFDVFRGNTTPVFSQGANRVVKGKQFTASEGHPFHSRNSSSGLKDIGGEFSTTKSWMDPVKDSSMTVSANVNGVQRVRNYTGPILPINPTTMPFPGSLQTSDDDLMKLGATAVARCKPTNSVADAATFLGELWKDRLPDLPGSSTWRDRTLTSRNAGEEFLNTEFGWLPLVSDVKSFARAVTTAQTVLAQYERDAGKVVRRRYNFPEQRTTNVEDMKIYNPSYLGVDDSTFYIGNPADTVRTIETVRRQWFSGAFTYGLPSGYDSRNALDRYALMADKVYGTSLTPEVLWELAPWSWAVDWFSNTGDVISNISDWSADGLVMVYGYMMEHTIHKHTYTQSFSGYNGNPAVSPVTMVTETKVRKRANPFGFGLTWDGLSPLQAAIAAAIGLTR